MARSVATGAPGSSADFSSPLVLNLVGTGVASPTITSISPKTGPVGGGTKVTVTGTNLVGITSAKIGSTAAKSVTCPTATSCTVVTPAGTGARDITVTNLAGTSAQSSADIFTYRSHRCSLLDIPPSRRSGPPQRSGSPRPVLPPARL